MATAGHYKEKTEGYEVIRRVDGITATRVFHDADLTADDDLPDIGDSLDPTDDVYKNCFVTEIRKVLFGNKPGQYLYTIQYTTTPGASDGANDKDGASVDPNFSPITGSIGGEAISVDAKTAATWKWTVGNLAMEQQLNKIITTGSFKVTKRLANLLLTTWAQYSGKINSSNFQVAGNNYPAERVMFNGVDYEEYRNNKGLRRWKVNYSFSVKSMKEGSSYYGWNYIFNDKTGKYDKPYILDGATKLYMYNTADLNKLLATPEAE
ncbi:MAG: hypothetical protein WC359_14265 [Dehalococcoidia bacterium]|jgi:hypothetical protein